MLKDVAPDFTVEARCPDDGIVEAIRWRGPSYVAGVQWHPEFGAHPTKSSFNDRQMLDSFLRAARERRANTGAITASEDYVNGMCI